jgi:hypothetical protein
MAHRVIHGNAGCRSLSDRSRHEPAGKTGWIGRKWQTSTKRRN